jgi:Ca2+/Na+ antiporter
MILTVKIIRAAIIIYLIFIGLLFILSLFSIEPSNKEFREIYAELYVVGIPCVILSSLFFTISSKNSKWVNIQFVIFTPVVTFFAYLFFSFLSIYFEDHWVNNTIVYENKINRHHTINEQLKDVGALGYGGERVVEIKPFLGVFQKVTEMDTTQMNHKDWSLVNRQGDIKWP